jgi:hypothetical protein
MRLFLAAVSFFYCDVFGLEIFVPSSLTKFVNRQARRVCFADARSRSWQHFYLILMEL